MSTGKRFACLILLFCASTSAACSDGVSPEDPAAISVDPVSVLGSCDKIVGDAAYASPNPFGDIDCGETITVETVGASSSERTETMQATNALGSVLDGQNGLPDLLFDGDEQSADHVIEVRFTGSGSYYFGSNSPGSNVVNIERTNDQFPNTPGVTVQIGKVNQVVLHEMMQDFRFKEKDFTNLENCAIEVEYPPGMSDDPCVHEEQTIYYVFGLREGDVDLSQSMLTGLNLSPSSLNLELPDTASIAATICESGSVCGGAAFAMSTDFESVEGTSNSVEGTANSVEGMSNVVIAQFISWDDPSNPAVVSLTNRTDAGAKVTALSEGNATISASLSSGPRVVWPPPAAAQVSVTVDDGPPQVDSVSITPSSAFLGLAGTGGFGPSGPEIQMTGTALDSSGTPIDGIVFNWSSDTPYASPTPVQGESTLVVGCSPYPTYAQGTITATAIGTSVSGTAPITIHKNHPYQCP